MALQLHNYTPKHTRTTTVYVMLAMTIYIGERLMFNTYIEDKAMIPVLLGYDWIIMKDTWTNCPYETYMYLKKKVIHNGNAKELSGFPNKRLKRNISSTII